MPNGRYAWAAGIYPVWNEEFVFHNADNSGSSLVIQLCDANGKAGLGKVIGELCLPLSELLQLRRLNGNLRLASGDHDELIKIPMHRRNPGQINTSQDGGVISVDIRVIGRFMDGEKELLEALELMGFEASFLRLKQSGFISISELFKVFCSFKFFMVSEFKAPLILQPH